MQSPEGLDLTHDAASSTARTAQTSVTGSDLILHASAAMQASRTRNRIGILVEDAAEGRLIEAASIHLDLLPIFLDRVAFDAAWSDSEDFDPALLTSFELLVADEPVARRICAFLAGREEKAEGIYPAVIAAASRESIGAASFRQPDHVFDGILSLPQTPAACAAQLSLVLYSHRAFAKRYQSAFEELQLNRLIFRSVTSGICIVNAAEPDLPLIYVNPAFEIMTGYTLEEVRGWNCRFLQKGEHDQAALPAIREAIRTESETTAILRNYRKDGTLFWNELSLSPIRNREGKLTHFVGIQNDVTARVEFEAVLRESEKLAAVGRLASSIAHEINNPLEAVMNLIYLAQHSDCSPETKKYLLTADRELQRVKLITAQSLRFYKQSTKAQAVHCSDLLDSVTDVYQSRMQNANVTVERRDRLTRSIICMESEIRQVLNNLVSNAIDAMHVTGGKLMLRTREATEWRVGTPGVMITVADTGNGMDPHTMRSMYKAFYTTKGIGGTGLGLWISSEIVERHGGRLRVRSRQDQENGWTVFELFLPFEACAA